MASAHNLSLTITSLLTILFGILHLADDISRGVSPAGLTNLTVIFVLALWLYATLALVERRSGQVVILVMSFLISGVPVIHMLGRSGIAGSASAGSVRAFFFAATLLALGGTAICSVILSLRGLWSLRRGRAPQANA
ncbi:MAG: hypothetical protein ABI609_17260 [Acidobacteriota bacterium]